MFIPLQVCLYELCGSHKIVRAYNVQKHISFIYLFIYFTFDPNTTDFLHTWDQTNSIFHVLRCRLIDLMLLVVRL